MKYYYAFYKDVHGTIYHQFTTCKDALGPEALYVTHVEIDRDAKKWYEFLTAYTINRPAEYIETDMFIGQNGNWELI